MLNHEEWTIFQNIILYSLRRSYQNVILFYYEKFPLRFWRDDSQQDVANHNKNLCAVVGVVVAPDPMRTNEMYFLKNIQCWSENVSVTFPTLKKYEFVFTSKLVKSLCANQRRIPQQQDDMYVPQHLRLELFCPRDSKTLCWG